MRNEYILLKNNRKENTMGKKRPSLVLNAILNSINSILSIVFPLITYPYVTRILQAENLGKVNFASSNIGYFSLIAALGISSYARREGVLYRDDRRKLNTFTSELFTLHLITTAFSVLMLVLACIAVPKFHDYTLLFAIYGSTIVFSTLGMEWLYGVQEDYLYMTARSVIMQVVSLVLMFVLVKKSTDFYIYAAINAFASVAPSIFGLFHSKKYVDLKICKNLKKCFSHLKACLVFFSSSVASSIYSSIDTTMLGFIASDFYVGIYAVAVRIYVMIKTLLGAVTAVMMPRLTSYVANGEKEEFNKLISAVFKLLWTFLLPVVLGLVLVAKEVVWLISGPGYEGAVSALQILSFAIFFAMFASVINGSILIPHKQEKNALKTTVAAAVVNAVLNLVAIPLFLQNGAAATTVVAECVVMAMGWRYARNLVKLESMKRTILTSLLGCAAIAAVCLGVQQLPVNMAASLFLKMGISVVIYAVVLLATGNELARQTMRALMKKMKN